MDFLFTTITDWYAATAAGTWHWFTSLSREEWMVVLGVGCFFGFLCVRGSRSRDGL